MDTSCQYKCICDHCVEKSMFPSISKLCNINECLNILTELDLSSSKIYEAPELIGNLLNIVKLNLSSNEIATLPLTFTKLEHLTDLILSHNKFTQIPQCLINGMQSITTLDLSHNNLLNISKKPFCIQQLLSFNVSNNLKLNNLPKWLWSLECNSLESLDISFTNCLEKIEMDPYLNLYGIGKNLKYLNISNTNSDIIKLHFVKHLKNLTTIIFDNINLQSNNNSQNFFSGVPLIFNYRFKNINSLSMSNVSLSIIEKHVYFSLPNLRFLNLSNNSIVTLPDSLSQLTNLEVCNFSFNQILLIPECFRNLKKLKKLILNNNWLSSFPNILEDILNLESLDLYANKLSTFSSWHLNSNIQSLDLEQNLFCTKNIDENFKDHYYILLNNLRLSTNHNRVMGPVYVEEFNDNESSCGSIGSSSHWSLYSPDVEYDIDRDNLYETTCNFKPEECWECDSYENTTDLFNPREFKLSLMNKLEKPLTFDEEIKERKIFKSVMSFTNRHYFCPSDELPKMIIPTTTNN